MSSLGYIRSVEEQGLKIKLFFLIFLNTWNNLRASSSCSSTTHSVKKVSTSNYRINVICVSIWFYLVAVCIIEQSSNRSQTEIESGPVRQLKEMADHTSLSAVELPCSSSLRSSNDQSHSVLIFLSSFSMNNLISLKKCKNTFQTDPWLNHLINIFKLFLRIYSLLPPIMLTSSWWLTALHE
jgi:hypothetical protein